MYHEICDSIVRHVRVRCCCEINTCCFDTIHQSVQFKRENNTTSSTRSDHRATQQLSGDIHRTSFSSEPSPPSYYLPCNAIYTRRLSQMYIPNSAHTCNRPKLTNSTQTSILTHIILLYNPPLSPTIILHPADPLPPATTTHQPPRVDNMTALESQSERLGFRVRQNQRMR